MSLSSDEICSLLLTSIRPLGTENKVIRMLLRHYDVVVDRGRAHSYSDRTLLVPDSNPKLAFSVIFLIFILIF